MTELSALSITPIGIVSSCYPEKFGIPRQPGLVRSSSGHIELLAPYNRREMVKGLEACTHIWVLFLFHQAVADGWRPTVRPPWLGGQQRVGVFATRSPHRPNFLGMSVVRLTGIRQEKTRLCLEIAQFDLLDKTPVIDIKPYIPYSDSVPGAETGFIPPPETGAREVVFSEEAADFCRAYELGSGRPLRALITETLAQDPRPASQRRQRREYGVALWDVNVRWQAQGERFFVLSITGAVEPGRAGF